MFTDGQANIGYTVANDIIRATVDSVFASGVPSGALGGPRISNRANLMNVPNRSSPVRQQLPQQRLQQQQLPQQLLPQAYNMNNMNNNMNLMDDDLPEKMEEDLPEKKELGDRLPLPCTINSFGFGQDHNADLLKQLADHGSGLYYYIESKEKIAESFADCLGGLLSTVVQNLTLSFRAEEGVTIKKIHTKFKLKEITPGKHYDLVIGDIQSEEEKDIIISVSLPRIDFALDKSDILKISLTYMNVIKKRDETTEITTSIARPDQGTGESRNYEIDKNLNRVIAAEAMESSNELAKNGELDKAKEVLESAATRISESVSFQDEFCKNLVKDIERCKEGVQSKASYNAVGSKMLLNQADAHSKQRSTNVAWGAQQVYQTSNRCGMYNNFKK